MKHTAIYVRVSGKLQDTASQEPDLKRWVEGHDGECVWYRDKFTGKTMDRPGFNRLVADIEAGKVARVVVWRLDRLGRTAKGLTALFEDLLAAALSSFVDRYLRRTSASPRSRRHLRSAGVLRHTTNSRNRHPYGPRRRTPRHCSG